MGSKGHKLDCETNNMVFDIVGPSGPDTKFRVGRFNSSFKPVIQVFHDGVYLLDFTKPFTVMMATKLDTRTAKMPILDGRNGPDVATNFWFKPSNDRDQLYFGYSPKSYRTKSYDNEKDMWRHVTFVFDGTNQKMFLNGSKWDIGWEYRRYYRNHVDKFNVGFQEPDFFLYGSIANIVVFEKALNLTEVQLAMYYLGHSPSVKGAMFVVVSLSCISVTVTGMF